MATPPNAIVYETNTMRMIDMVIYILNFITQTGNWITMSNIHNLTALIAKKSRELAEARTMGEEDEVERLEDELFDLEEDLEAAEEAVRDGPHGWH